MTFSSFHFPENNTILLYMANGNTQASTKCKYTMCLFQTKLQGHVYIVPLHFSGTHPPSGTVSFVCYHDLSLHKWLLLRPLLLVSTSSIQNPPFSMDTHRHRLRLWITKVLTFLLPTEFRWQCLFSFFLNQILHSRMTKTRCSNSKL